MREPSSRLSQIRPRPSSCRESGSPPFSHENAWRWLHKRSSRRLRPKTRYDTCRRNLCGCATVATESSMTVGHRSVGRSLYRIAAVCPTAARRYPSTDRSARYRAKPRRRRPWPRRVDRTRPWRPTPRSAAGADSIRAPRRIRSPQRWTPRLQFQRERGVVVPQRPEESPPATVKANADAD